ncbi:nuclear transport factor 2 family protein [Aequorivita marina]|uniref:nuclear transport factor 2 family protein n=1 Tax=Aequorivita marina TaxID=3073654 RepID=UPI002875C7A6|nr:nuclear transport factor 2 family protein [Aequorivita sp. S2608]MDS1297674.1 nuclear transport factor 2 family protein [Aequorivita sp. S2608]
MSKEAKEVVRDFYRSDILGDKDVMERFFHPDLTLIWNSPTGLSIKNYDDIVTFFSEVRKSYDDIRVEVSHLLADGPHVTVRYKYYVRTMENPDEELGIAHFMSIFEVKDDKIYRGYQISQPVTDNDDTTESYHKVKV